MEYFISYLNTIITYFQYWENRINQQKIVTVRCVKFLMHNSIHIYVCYKIRRFLADFILFHNNFNSNFFTQFFPVLLFVIFFSTDDVTLPSPPTKFHEYEIYKRSNPSISDLTTTSIDSKEYSHCWQLNYIFENSIYLCIFDIFWEIVFSITFYYDFSL